MEQYRVCELTYQGSVLTDHWAQIDLTAVFSCKDQQVTVRGFYDGAGVYKVRFLPMAAGVWQYQVSGVITDAGTLEVLPAAPGADHSPVYAEGCHFRRRSGALFWPFGTTVYALAHQEDTLVRQTLESLKASPFNKVRMCIFPKHYDYNHNEPPLYAFEKTVDGRWDVNRPDPAFWQRLERILAELDQAGIQAALILFHPYDRWGFAQLSAQENRIYLDTVLRRLSAFPNVWWSLANEYDLCAAKTAQDWCDIEAFVASHDPAHHLLSCHNCFAFWDHSRPAVTHASLQTKMLARISEWRDQYQKPIVVDECCYEGDLDQFWGSISGREMTNRFWRVVTTGGYCTHGETFLDPEEVLWWARGGVLRGESPARIAFLRGIVESLPGPIEPLDLPVSPLFRMAARQDRSALEQMLAVAPEQFRHALKAVYQLGGEATFFAASEAVYMGHCGEDAYLVFYDLRPCPKGWLELPENHRYRVELIDTWNMTRTELLPAASGKTPLTLPGREGMAVLAVRIDG